MIPGLLFVLESFRRHMDNGRWLFQLGMEAAGYQSVGGGLPPPGIDATDVGVAVACLRPQVAILWPRYEWDPQQWRGPAGTVLPEHRFHSLDRLIHGSDVLRVAVFHDAGSERARQRLWHEEFKPHAYLVWYHERSVAELAPHVPPHQMVRTWHIVDPAAAPAVEPREGVCCVSGAWVPDVYPFRTRCVAAAKAGQLGRGVVYREHPGYHYTGTSSNDYLRHLAGFRVSLCTASAYKFALRKHIEATAAGCRVITDLPDYDHLPGIDGNLIRVRPDIPIPDLAALIREAAEGWDLATQRAYAAAALRRYDYRFECARLAKELQAWKERILG